MPSQTTTSPPLTVTVLAALWVSLGRCGVSESPGPGCDNGKLFLNRDLPAITGDWDCSASTWAESTQRHPSIDTVYDPEPARQICMDEPISYNRTIPNSGAHRPVMAHSGEYLYCPPQRWIGNLHHGAAVLLYHPCAPRRERLLLSVLARSCLSDYVVTPHPQLGRHMPVALVSWGRTLELPTAASSDVCDWLETTASARHGFSGASGAGAYDLLLTRPAERRRLRLAKTRESLRQCCEEAVSSPLTEPAASGTERPRGTEREGKRRAMRAAVREKRGGAEHKSDPTDGTILRRTGGVQNSRRTVGPPAESPPGPEEAPSQSKIQNVTQGLPPRPTTPSRSNISTPRSDSVASGGAEAQKSGTQTPPLQLSPKRADPKKSDPPADTDVVDVKERELEQERSHSARHKSESESEPQSEPPPQPQRRLNPPPDGRDCESCTAGQRCDCAEAGAAVASKVLPRTPRTDEAVWAAAALGFLLVLLTLSVLHTRLYRHWRTAPSLYWRDPRQDYDSVADVIRRRLRIAKRRRKRGRRQECVLLPSSSSSDELP